jgi:nucleoside-diphosphate-sugar epimerase
MTISQDPSAPLIAVVGATGMQGGSIVNNLQASIKPYRMRGLTRDASKPNAQSPVKRGIEVVSCNICVGNEAEVRKAFEGASYVLVGTLERVRSLNVPTNKQAVTNYWEHVDKACEIAEGKLMADVAKAAGVKLFILSSEPSATKVSKGRLDKVSRFDSKAEVSDHPSCHRV